MSYGLSNPFSGKGPTGSTVGNITPKGMKLGQLGNFTPEMMSLFKQLFQHVSPESYLSRLGAGEEGIFDEMEAPAFRQFNAQQGNIASRFSGMGGKGSFGSRQSSGFQNDMSQASSNFAQDLQSRRQSLQQQAIRELMGLGSNLLSQRPYEQFLVDKQQKPSAWGGFLGGLGGAIPGAIGGLLSGGPGGAAAGGVGGFASGMLGSRQ